MGSRRIRALDLFAGEDVQRLEEAGFLRCEDLIFQSAETVAKVLRVPLPEARQTLQRLDRRMAPAPVPLLGLPQCAAIPTSLPSLDRSMGGGLPGACLLELMGPPGAGKSQFAMMLTALCAREGPGGVLYIDTERKFSGDRVQAMSGSAHSVLENVHLREAPTLDDFLAIFRELDLQVVESGARLLVIDSIAAVVRCEGLSMIARSQLLSKLATQLKQLTHRYGITVALTNQVSGNNQAALGNTWHHAVSIRVALVPAPCGVGVHDQPRSLTVMKSHMSPTVTVPYRITAAGIVEAGMSLAQ